MGWEAPRERGRIGVERMLTPNAGGRPEIPGDQPASRGPLPRYPRAAAGGVLPVAAVIGRVPTALLRVRRRVGVDLGERDVAAVSPEGPGYCAGGPAVHARVPATANAPKLSMNPKLGSTKANPGQYSGYASPRSSGRPLISSRGFEARFHSSPGLRGCNRLSATLSSARRV